MWFAVRLCCVWQVSLLVFAQFRTQNRCALLLELLQNHHRRPMDAECDGEHSE
jgi:hypothetical protein